MHYAQTMCKYTNQRIHNAEYLGFPSSMNPKTGVPTDKQEELTDVWVGRKALATTAARSKSCKQAPSRQFATH
eukprot:1136807-Pelagomonas_calceolata.AAC.5